MATPTRLFRWGLYYQLGLETIDRQHAHLVGRLNELYNAWQEDAPRPEMSRQLQVLIDAVQEHFETEEKLMFDRGYPAAESHRAEHLFLANHVAQFQRGFEAGETEFAESVMTHLKDWLRDHILISDKKMSEYLLTH